MVCLNVFHWLSKKKSDLTGSNPRRKLFKVIPLNGLQAHFIVSYKGTWEQYKRMTTLRLVQDSKTQLISLAVCK